jgi:hypothetical protein
MERLWRSTSKLETLKSMPVKSLLVEWITELPCRSQTMPQAILSQILDQLQTLEPSELEQLSQVIQRYLEEREVSAKHIAFHQALVESGLVQRIKNPIFEQRTHQPLIQVQGEAVSQTIIEERR